MFILVTGGVASGKSEIAEDLAVQLQLQIDPAQKRLAYAATMSPPDPADLECQNRIEKHRTMRNGKGFDTLEIPFGLYRYIDELGGYKTVLVECMSNLVANEMFMAGKNAEDTIQTISTEISHLHKKVENIVIVSNTIFTDLKGYDEFTQRFIQVMGRLNSLLAESADTVLEVVCAIPIVHKGKKEILNENLD